MSEIRHDKKVTIELDTPLVNQGNWAGGKHIPNGNKTEFFGKVEVDAATAEDLLRRQKEYHAYERSLIRDNGQNREAAEFGGK